MKWSARTWMYAFWGIQCLLTFFDEFFWYRGLLDQYFIFSALVTGVTLFAWFLADARESNFHPGRFFKAGVLVFGFVLIPYYLIKVKGWRRAGISFIKFIAFIAVYEVYFRIINYIGFFRIS